MSKSLIFVGGFSAPGIEWPLTPLRRIAREQGWRTKYFNERLIFGPITKSAERLVPLVEEMADIHEDGVIVVGHSMGGLVGEHAGALGAPMDGLVTLGTPHRGTLSYLAPPFFSLPVMREMAAGSAYLKSVEDIPGWRPPILAVVGSKDRLIPTNSRPDRPHTLLRVPGIGHIGLIFDQSTANSILEWANHII